MSVKRIVPDIKSKDLDASRQFYVDVDDVHARAVSRGFKVVYPVTNEPWGVRRFFVTDPNGTIINVMCHMGGSHSRDDLA